MLRKLFFLFLFIIGFGLLINFFLPNSGKKLYSPVPKGSIALLEFKDAENSIKKIKKTQYWNMLQEVPMVDKLLANYSFIDSVLLFKNSQAPQAQNVLASLHLSKANDYDFLFLFEENLLPASLKSVCKIISDYGFSLNETTFKGTSIFTLQKTKQDKSKSKAISLSILNGIVLASFNPILIEEVLVQNTEFATQSLYKNVKSFDSTGEVILHLNLKNIPLLTSVYFKAQSSGSNFLSKISSLSNWASWGLNFENNSFAFIGNTDLNNENNFLAKISQNDRKRTHTNLILGKYSPINTVGVYFQKLGNLNTQLNSLSEKQINKLPSKFSEWIGSEFAIGFTEPTQATISKSFYSLFHVLNPEDAIKSLLKVSHSAPVPPIINYRNYKLFPIDAEGFHFSLFGETVGRNFRSAYFTIINDVVIIAANSAQLELIIQQIDLGKCLQNDPNFLKREQQMDVANKALFYLEPARLKQWFKYNSSKSFASDLELNFEKYSQIGPLSAEMVFSDSKSIQLGHLDFKAEGISSNTLLWCTNIQAKPARAPQVVKGLKKGEKNILIQDEENRLYLLNKEGHIIWEKQMDHPIMGNVYQLDFENNGQYSFLFNTRYEVYRISTKGEIAQNYPKRLSAAAHGGLGVAKLAEELGYHYFVPCGEDRVYGYKISGMPVESWSPKFDLGKIIYPIQHFSVGKVDYLVTANSENKTFLLDRNGKVLNSFTASASLAGKPQIDYQGGEIKVIISTNNSHTYAIKTDGSVVDKKYLNEKVNKFLTENVLGSKDSEERLFLTDDKLKVFNPRGKICEYILPQSEKCKTAWELCTSTKVNDEIKHIGLFCPTAEEIYLTAKYGKFKKGFPIPATTAFKITDLYNTNSEILIVGSPNNSICAYSIN